MHAENPLLPIRLERVSYQLERKTLLDHLETTIESSGISMIIGANGAGKSLLLQLLHGLCAPSRGKITWGARKSPFSREILAQQAMVFQKPILLRQTVLENVSFALQHHPSTRLSRSAAKAHAQSLLEQYTLTQHASTPAMLLSGGEQQRLALARAEATQPKLLLLDEPTANLDPNATAQIEARIRDISERGVKVLMVSHDRDQIRRLANEILFLHRGKLMEQSAANAFIHQPKTTLAQCYWSGELLTDDIDQ